MWNKQKDEPMAHPQPEPVRNSAPQPAAAPGTVYTPGAARPSMPTAAIGPSMSIKGEIRAREELLVEGEVEGLLESQSLIRVGANGKVRANIKAREVVIYGSVRGDVEVAEKIAIREQGSLIGNIKSAGISIDDGAYFKGSIDIVRPDPKVNSKPVLNEAKAAVQAS
ncbi:MAG: polymer-forming cytoskeletal protein [Acidobacteria bacterium]|nr:polymer-forming cytoskeletal protein [Acidobacteriota bacterium]